MPLQVLFFFVLNEQRNGVNIDSLRSAVKHEININSKSQIKRLQRTSKVLFLFSLLCKTILYSHVETAIGHWKLINKFHEYQEKVFRKTFKPF